MIFLCEKGIPHENRDPKALHNPRLIDHQSKCLPLNLNLPNPILFIPLNRFLLNLPPILLNLKPNLNPFNRIPLNSLLSLNLLPGLLNHL